MIDFFRFLRTSLSSLILIPCPLSHVFVIDCHVRITCLVFPHILVSRTCWVYRPPSSIDYCIIFNLPHLSSVRVPCWLNSKKPAACQSMGIETSYRRPAITSDASWASAWNYLHAVTSDQHQLTILLRVKNSTAFTTTTNLIATIDILLRVKNSTAFARDDEFDRNKRSITRSWCGGGTGMRRRLSSIGVRRSVDPRIVLPDDAPPFFGQINCPTAVKSTAW